MPNPLAVTYYAQRASAGLLITEATQVSPQGVGYIRTPGMHSPEQVAGWRKVTEAVHAAGGVIFAQLWHVGRVSHPDFHEGRLPVAPSAIGFEGEVFTFQGRKRVVTPRALETEELPGVVEQFRRAAENAREAGFDGVELHGSNGYLLDQFLRDGSNQRTDAYGGSLENRARFPLEVARAVVDIWGAERVGYRLSPQPFPYAGMTDSNPAETFTYMASELNRLGLGYLHVTEAVSGKGVAEPGAAHHPAAAQGLPGSAHRQRRLRRAGRRGGDRPGRGGSRRLRRAVPRQPGSAGALPAGGSAQCAGRRHLLHGRGEGLHGLPGAALNSGGHHGDRISTASDGAPAGPDH